ncbi:WD40 repeat-like protein [Patellaria atrata CBS 101060]|uniref:WD40 repeat-like protein n=1 Tax=Patellaria atrata CBS 101060 TaxID=1346257 RepID=A0A9P4SIZ2_9PEZI|nr:WD40 repeat-like protein [Patellaria atrata CBS 101060]
MDGLEVSQMYKCSQLSILSPDNAHIASIINNRLQIRETSSLEITRSIPIPGESFSKVSLIRWSACPRTGGESRRILLSNEDNARIYDLRDERWSATINNGSGGMGKIANVEFGRNENEALVFSDFGAKVVVWSLISGRSVEIRDPKFSTKGFGYGVSGVFALLSRPAAQDILTLHAPDTYFVLRTVTLPTVDVQGLSWSPDGRWLAVWDASSSGYRVMIYTADGHLYRTYCGEQDGEIQGPGVKNIKWSPRGDYLAVGSYDRKLTLLSTRTFSPNVFLDHAPTIHLPTGEVWQETVSTSSPRRLTMAPQPFTPPIAPTTPSDSSLKQGVSLISFNSDGTLVATRSDSFPTTVWIWDLTRLTPLTVLVQHSAVRQLLWHPSRSELLLTHCTQDEPIIYLYDSMKTVPQLLSLASHFTKPGPRQDARWLHRSSSQRPGIMFSDTRSYMLVWPEGREVMQVPKSLKTPDKEDESEDSLYDILTGRTPLPVLVEETALRKYEDEDEDEQGLEDTFRGKGKTFVDSLDECF